MNTDFAKIVGFLAFIVLWGTAIDWLMDITPILLMPILVL